LIKKNVLKIELKINSDTSNYNISKYIDYCISQIPNPVKYNYIVSGDEKESTQIFY